MLLEEARTTLENKIDKYRQILEKAPDDRTVLLALAEASYRRGLRLEALHAYQRVLENESIPEAHLAMAQMYAQHGLHVEAFQELACLLSQEPANPEAHILAVQVGEENEMPQELKDFVEAGTTYEEISKARVRLGLHRSMLMREITELSRVAERSRSEPLAEYYVLQTRNRLSALDFALARLDTLEQAVELKLRESERLRELELTRQRELEELQQAAVNYDEASAAAPEYAESLELLPRPELVEPSAEYPSSEESWAEQPVSSEEQQPWMPPSGHDPAAIPIGESQEWALAHQIEEYSQPVSADSWEEPATAASDSAEPVAAAPEYVPEYVPEAAGTDLDLPEVSEGSWGFEVEPAAPAEFELELNPLELTLEPDLPPLQIDEPALPVVAELDFPSAIAPPLQEEVAPGAPEFLAPPVAATPPAPEYVAPVAPPPVAVAPPPVEVAPPPPVAVAPPPVEVAPPPPVAVAPPPVEVAPPPPAAVAPPPVEVAAPVGGTSSARLEFYNGITAGLDSLVSTLAKTRGVTSIYVVSRDGHLIGEASKDAIGRERISEIVVEGLMFLEGFAAAPQYWVLECNGGIVVMQTIDNGHVLVAIGQAGANFGALRYTMDKTKPSFAQLLAGAPD